MTNWKRQNITVLEVFQAMNDLRIVADEIENVMDRKLYPYPNYGDLLFGVR